MASQFWRAFLLIPTYTGSTMAKRELEHKKQIEDLNNQLHASRSTAFRPDQTDDPSVGVAEQAL